MKTLKWTPYKQQPAGGLASAADLLKQEEQQFVQPSINEQRANFKPDPNNLNKLVDLMRAQSEKERGLRFLNKL